MRTTLNRWGSAVLVVAFVLNAGPALLSGAAFAQGQAGTSAIPDFSGYWVRPNPGSTRVFHPVPGRAGPIMPHADDNEFDIGDHTNPILKPHAAAAVKAHGDSGRAGILVLPSWSLCQPTGSVLTLLLGEAVQFLQTPEQVTILYQRDHQTRRIYLNQPHSPNPKPSWYGESVGHYEGGDTLVIDTIAHKAGTAVDKYGTPHSEKMRVVERFTLRPDRRAIDVTFTVEDPETFNAPWSAQVAYSPDAGPIAEVVCSENNRNAGGGDYPIPVATKADF